MIDKKQLTMTLKSNDRTLSMGTGTNYGLLTVEGIEAGDITLNMKSNAQFDGSQVIGYRVEPRVIAIEAEYRGSGDPESIRHQIEDFFVVHHPGVLTVNYCGTERHISYRTTVLKDKRANLYDPFAFYFELTCPNPHFIGDEFSKNIAESIPALSSGFAIWEESGSAMEWKLFADEVKIINNGACSTGLTIEFVAHGEVLNPRIDNLTTGEFLKIGYANNPMQLKSGDHLVIKTGIGTQRIELNGINISNKKDRASSYFQLTEGQNALKYSAESGYTALDVYLNGSAEYMGV